MSFFSRKVWIVLPIPTTFNVRVRLNARTENQKQQIKFGTELFQLLTPFEIIMVLFKVIFERQQDFTCQ